MSIVLDNPELEAAAQRLATARGIDVRQIAESALENYILATENVAVRKKGEEPRVTLEAIMAIGRRCASAAVFDDNFSQDSLYDEAGLPNGPFR